MCLTIVSSYLQNVVPNFENRYQRMRSCEWRLLTHFVPIREGFFSCGCPAGFRIGLDGLTCEGIEVFLKWSGHSLNSVNSRNLINYSTEIRENLTILCYPSLPGTVAAYLFLHFAIIELTENQWKHWGENSIVPCYYSPIFCNERSLSEHLIDYLL